MTRDRRDTDIAPDAARVFLRGLADVPGGMLRQAAFGTSLIAPDGALLDVNQEFCRMLGYEPQELIGRNLLDFVHPDDHGLIERLHGEMRDGTRESDQTRRLYVRKDGSILYALAGITAVRDERGRLLAIVKQIQDLTSRVRMERELHENTTRQRVVIDSLQEGVVIYDADGRVRISNPSAREILGLSAAQLHGRHQRDPLWRVTDEDGQPIEREVLPYRRALDGGTAHTGIILRVERPDGTVRWIRTNVQPLMRPGEDSPYAVVASFSDVSVLKERERELIHHTLHDALTDLPNRRFFLEYLGRIVEDPERAEHALDAVLYIDLDGFKRVNDRYGHGVGDSLLVRVAHRLALVVHPNDVVARLAGDEFAALLTNVGSSARAVDVARRIVDAMAEPFAIDGMDVRIGASVGVTLVQGEDADPKEVLNRADVSLRRAKQDGKSRFVQFNERVDLDARRAIQLERDLPYALERGELAVDYYPVLPLAGGPPVAEKAVLRWTHERYGRIEHDQMLELAREIGLLPDLQRWVGRQALRRLMRFPGDGRHACLIVSTPRETLGDDSAERVRQALGEAGVAPSRMVMAIDAGDDSEADDELMGLLKRLAETGVELMLESSGRGRGRPRQHSEFPYRWLGGHRDAILRGLESRANRVMTRGVLDSIRRVGVKVIAEVVAGVDHAPEQLAELGFDYALGEPAASSAAAQDAPAPTIPPIS